MTLYRGDRLLGCEGSSLYVVLIQRVEDGMTGDKRTIVYLRDLTRNILRAVNDYTLNEELDGEAEGADYIRTA